MDRNKDACIRSIRVQIANSTVSILIFFPLFFSFFLKDPHDELKGQNVLIVRGGEEETAAKFGISVDLLQEGVLKPALSIMRTARERRPAPHLDDKMVAAWNGT